MTTNPKNKKEEARSVLLRHLGLPKGTRATVISYIRDPEISSFISIACNSIGVTLITEIDNISLSGADIWITDLLDESIPFLTLAQNRVVPIVPVSSSKQFSEFDPMRFEGNAFIFQSVDQFQIFEKLVRALENMRYAGDKRILLANVEKMV
ncbi:hypothetical protein H7169_00250 [Candidatus Gracilibacteria bacterium]|nr:hypothetical protein [Candidatus Gracilibacteria bacterium]